MILSHILVVFVFLCMSKSLELLSGHSIKKIKDTIWNIEESVLLDTLTNKKFTKRIKIPENEITSLWINSNL